MLRNAMRAIKSLLTLIDAADEQVCEMSVGASKKTATTSSNDDVEPFDHALSVKTEAHDSIIVGSLELIGLDDIRNIMGESWPAIAAKVSEIAQQELQRCLDPSDIFRSHGEASFLIHFGSLDKLAAEHKAQRTALRIKAALIEQVPEIAEAISIKHFVADVDPSSLQGDCRSLADALFDRLIAMRKDAEIFLRRDRRSIVKNFQVQFSPVWHTQKQVTILNRCQLYTTLSGTFLSQFQDLADPDDVTATYAELDYLTLTQSLEALHRSLQAGRSAMMLIPVDFGTILSETSVAEYMRLLSTMPAAYKKFVIVEMCAAATTHPASSLLQIANILGRYVKYVALELLLDDPRIEPIISGCPWAVSLNLSGLNSSNLQLAVQLRQFASTANAGAVNTLARGANSVGLAVAATEAGFTYVDGPAIHLPLREPRPPLPLRPLPRSSSTGTVWSQPKR